MQGIERIRSWLETATGKRLQRAGYWAFMLGLLGYLAYSLTDIGWQEVLQALPRTPLFYLLFLGIYFTLPVVETLAYSYLWGVSPWRAFPVFLKKRIYNKDVLGYSGEVYLYLWAHRRLGLERRRIFRDIRDNTLVSSAVSTLVAVGLLAAFMFSGQVRIPGLLEGTMHAGYWIGGGGLMLVGGGLLWRFRRYFFNLSRRQALVLAGLHTLRLLLVNLLQVLQWAVVLPSVAWSAWFTFLSMQIVLGRIPFLPSRDLVFLGTGMELSRALDLPTAEVAGMLLVSAVLGKVLNVVLLGLLMLRERRRPEPRLAVEES